MKFFAFFVLASLSSINLFSQDTLYTTTGKVINGKVIEINPNEIKYKKACNPDGPTYVLYKSEVVLIHYKNGSKDVFSSESTDNNAVATNSNNQNTQQPTVINNNYTNYPNNGYYRSGVNVLVSPMPYVRFRPWGGYYGGYYRYNHFYRGGGGYRGGGHHGGGHHGHR